jgi:hypothetical protein
MLGGSPAGALVKRRPRQAACQSRSWAAAPGRSAKARTEQFAARRAASPTHAGKGVACAARMMYDPEAVPRSARHSLDDGSGQIRPSRRRRATRKIRRTRSPRSESRALRSAWATHLIAMVQPSRSRSWISAAGTARRAQIASSRPQHSRTAATVNNASSSPAWRCRRFSCVR